MPFAARLFWPAIPCLLAGGLLVAAAAISPASAVSLLAVGSLAGSSAGADGDLSGLTGRLENGLAANILGGFGSSLAWAGGNSFIAVPDRGPNATAYNSGVDDTTSYIARFQTISMRLTASAGGGLTLTLTPTLTATTLLYSSTALNYGDGAGLGLPAGSAVNVPGKNYFTGRPDNFGTGSSTNPNNARLDPEGVRVSADGKSVFVSDEYGPYVYQFDRATGERLRAFALPAHLTIANLSPKGSIEISGNVSGRTTNKGMEGLAITLDGKTLVGIMQAALLQDDVLKAGGKTVLRIVTVDIAGAIDVTATNGTDAAKVAVAKTEFVDLVTLLVADGVTAANVPSKIEGVAIGDDVIVDGVSKHTLWITNDNDFVPGSAGPNQFYVLGFDQSDLGGTVLTQQAMPEPATLAILGVGLLAGADWSG
jgi:hypothetical protein